jgi:hypothetical protein
MAGANLIKPSRMKMSLVLVSDGRGGHDEKYLHNKFRSISVSLLNSTSISVPTIE